MTALPNTLTNGTTADADQVMANFNSLLSDYTALKAQVDALPVATSTPMDALQAGVIGASDLMVTQRGAGANMSVDVGSGTVWVTSSAGVLTQAVKASTTNVAVTSNSSGNPRVDQVVITSAGVISVLAGTATSGATLANRTGAASVPSGSLRLADILVANSASSVSNSSIRDRRPWARGAFFERQNTGASLVTSTTTAVENTSLKTRVECSGVPCEVWVRAWVTQSAGSDVDLGIFINGVANYWQRSPTTSAGRHAMVRAVVTPTAGTNQFSFGLYNQSLSGTATVGLAVDDSRNVQFAFREIVAADTYNNSVTSG